MIAFFFSGPFGFDLEPLDDFEPLEEGVESIEDDVEPSEEGFESIEDDCKSTEEGDAIIY